MQNEGNRKSGDLLQKFKPSAEADLAVHVKKIEEVKQWLTAAQQMNAATQILLITGPSGSGKSVCLKTIAQEMKLDVTEWTTPVEVDLFFEDSYDFDGRKEKTGKRSQKALFDDFLYKTSRYCSIFNNTGAVGTLLVVKDFPNSMLRRPEEFHDTLERFRDSSTTPLVFIATDTSSKTLDIAYHLFPDAIVERFQIHHIKFNAVSASLLRKAIKRISTIIKGDKDLSNSYQVVPSKAAEDNLIASSQGDLRNCCLNYLFTCMKCGPSMPKRPCLEAAAATTTGKMVPSESSKPEAKNALGMNENLSIMHGLGRIFHPKFLKTDGIVRFVHSPESIAECFATEPVSIISLLHSNYVTRCSDIQNLSAAADVLTLVDVIMNEYRNEQLAQYGLNIAVRSMMVNNEQTGHSWQQIKKKKQVQQHPSVTSYPEELLKSGVLERPVPTRIFTTECKSYVSIIHKKPFNKSHA